MLVLICMSSKIGYLHSPPPYHVLFPEPRLLHYVFFTIFYPKDHSKEASNEIALKNLGVMNRKIDELIRLTSLLHWAIQLAILMQGTDFARAAQIAD